MVITEKIGRPLGLPKTGGRAKGTPNRATQSLREKLAALGCDPMGELVKIAQNSKSEDTKVQIYSNLMPYAYPKRKPADDSSEGKITVDRQGISPEEALDLARDLIATYGPHAAAPPEVATPVIEGKPNQPAEKAGDEN